jgi:carboxymethylenebutenolidase
MAQPNVLRGDDAANLSHGRFSRRDALRRLALVGIAAGVSGTFLAGCGTSGAASSGGSAASSAPPPGRGPDTPRGSDVTFPGPSGTLHGSWAAPTGKPRAAVLVVHDNAGLTPHYADLVGRFAGAGYAALSVDLLSGLGGSTGAGDAAKVLASASPQALDAELRAGIAELARRAPGVKIGAVGFGFGAGLLWRHLGAGDEVLAAVVPFYGFAADDLNFSKSHAAVLGIYPDNDAKLSESQDNTDQALMNANLVHSATIYQGAAAGFFDDTGPRYDGAAATKAWQATLDWFKQYL